MAVAMRWPAPPVLALTSGDCDTLKRMEKSRMDSATRTRRSGATPRRRSAVKATRSATLVSAARRRAEPRSLVKIANAIAIRDDDGHDRDRHHATCEGVEEFHAFSTGAVNT
jgi:hypothetical protein